MFQTTNQNPPQQAPGIPQGTASAMHFTRVCRAARCASLPEASPKSRHSCILHWSNAWEKHMEGLPLVTINHQKQLDSVIDSDTTVYVIYHSR